MLKMKMISFFKNPVVRNSIIVLAAIAIIASIISIPVSNAGSQINVAFRAAPMGINAGSKVIQMPEISPDQSADKKSKYDSVFCIDEGNVLSYGIYTNEYDAYNSGEASKYFKNYNSALWLIDNMYISKAENKGVGLNYLAQLVTSPDVSKNITAYGNVTTDEIKALDKTVGGVKDVNGNVMNRNFIEVIEQLVLWNYTDNTASFDSDSVVDAGFSGINITDEDQKAAKYLYYALKHLANKKTSYKSSGTVANAISLDSSNAVIDVENSKVGPYALKSNGVILNIDSNLKSKISATITKIDGSTQDLDSNSISVNKDGKFYVNIKDCGQVKKSKLNISKIYTGSTGTANVIANGSNQNLVNVKKSYSTKALSDEKSISYSGKYTVKLIKTNSDGKTVITNNPAEFTITGAVTKNKEKTGNDGKLTIADNRKISDVKAVEKYTIVEDKAPSGYKKYNGTITLDVAFKVEGTTYILDKDKIKMSANGSNGTVNINIPNNNTIEIYVPNQPDLKSDFDLALRKFITKVDGKAVEVSREPVIDNESKYVLQNRNTAVYHHTKQSLKVKEGSEVEYTIRIYNEGKVDGYAKEITDYLPSGLSFVKIADESSKLYSTDAKSDTKKVVIKYNGSEVIKADSIGRILNKDTKNIYQEVKLICKVNKGAKGYITNRAEITNYGYTDKDGKWHPAKALNDSDRDSVQNTVGNYELALDTWYKEEAYQFVYTYNGSSKVVKDYYPGVQDDDDFETVEIEEPAKKEIFDLSLRKFITNVNGKEITTRIPKVTVTDDFKSGKATTAKYEHPKDPVEVANGNIVTYTIRVYNEGNVDGYATKVMDDIPSGLQFLPENSINKENNWVMYKESDKEVEGSIKYNNKIYVRTDDSSKADLIVTDKIKDQLIKAYDSNTMKTLDYKDVKVAFKVIEPNSSDRILTNYAQITEHKDKNGKTTVKDRDSTPNVWNEGEDDQDIEKVKLKEEKIEKTFDLALRKFITNVDGKEISSRIPKVTVTNDFKNGKATTAKYEHPKDPVEVENGNIVTYTIRVYNEGEADGYATKIMDDIPDGLEYLPSHETNKEFGWVMYTTIDDLHQNKGESTSIQYKGVTYVETTDASSAKLIVTKKLDKELIKGYDAKTMKTLDYKDVKVAFKVIEPNNSDKILINYAQITEHKDDKGNSTVIDRDSTPNEWNEGEDDQDIEKVKLKEKDFDLALRKFITNVNGKEITSRIPTVVLTDDFKAGKVTTATYEHPKDPVDVVKDNIVVYTIRVYNEGELNGYATKVMDDIPDGLEYLPTNEVNVANEWKMYVESDAEVAGSIKYNNKIYAPTEDASKADLIVTEKLKNDLIKAYDAKTMETLDYKDVKVAFKVTEPSSSDRVIINYAQITENKDENGKVVTDRDSEPNEWNEGEDDQDIEKIKLRRFDLALRKWVTEAIVTENGKTQVIQTGHKAEDDPESVVKVDLKKSKLSDVTVKFRYSIRVTNEGEIAGYAKEVTDYIPQGLLFNEADNEGWTLAEGNIVKTNALANTLLNPGESAEVTIVLTWANSQSNMGTKINTAEISEDYNEYGAHDIDSTPNNKVPGEDDIDDAPIMLTVKTGSVVIYYVALGVAFMAIIGVGVFFIRKRTM